MPGIRWKWLKLAKWPAWALHRYLALPTLRPVKHPRDKFRISYSDARHRTASGRPKEIHRYFNDEAEARRELTRMGGIVADQGVAGLQLEPALRRDALVLLCYLSNFDLTWTRVEVRSTFDTCPH